MGEPLWDLSVRFNFDRVHEVLSIIRNEQFLIEINELLEYEAHNINFDYDKYGLQGEEIAGKACFFFP